MLTIVTAAAFAGGAGPFSPAYEGNCQAPKWSPDGGRLAYEVNYHDLKVVEQYVQAPGADPQKVEPVTVGSSSLTAGFSGGPPQMVVHELAWSPASLGTLLTSASGTDRDYDLYLETGSPIAAAPGADGGAAWSPDGQHIAFSSARTGQGDVYLLSVADLAAAPRQITGDPTSSELYVTWSPDSRSLAFVGHTRTGDNVYLVPDIDYPAPAPITTWSRTQTRPSFSPDGAQLAFYSNHAEAQRFDLYVMSVDGGTPRLQVEGVVMNHDGPQWTPDGQGIVYVKDDDDAYDPVYTVRVGNPASATRIDTGTVGNGDLDVVVGTDGRTYLAVAAQGRADEATKDYKRIYVMVIE